MLQASLSILTSLEAELKNSNEHLRANMDGSLHEIEVHNRSNGVLPIIRLIGTVYFKKYLPSFISIDGHETPIQSYNGIDSSLPPNERHKKWMERIRSIVADRIMTEEQCVPSYTSYGDIRCDHVGQHLYGDSHIFQMFTLIFHHQKDVDGQCH